MALSSESFGVYIYILSVVLLLVLVGDFGMSTSASRYTAEYLVRDKPSIKKIVPSIGGLILIITILISLLIIYFGKTYFESYYEYFLFAIPLLILIPLSSFLDGVHRGLLNFKLLSYLSLLSLLVSIPFSLMLILSFGIKGAILSHILFYSIYLLGLVFFYKYWSLNFSTRVLKEVGYYSMLVGLASIGFFLSAKANILILGHYSLFEEIGVYELINKLLMFVLLPLQILGQIIAPRFATLNAAGNFKKIIENYKRYLLFSLAVSVILLILIYFVLPLIFGFVFKNYSLTLFGQIFLPTLLIYFVYFVSAPLNQGILISTGYVNLMLLFNLLMAGINLLLGPFFVKSYGISGILWLLLAMVAISTLITQFCFYRSLKQKIV